MTIVATPYGGEVTPSERDHPEEEHSAPEDAGTPLSESQAWELIVANYGDPVLPATPGRDEHPAGSGRTERDSPPATETPDPVAEREERWEQATGFTPPTPPPLPRPSLPRLVAWVGVLGVPLFLLVSLFAGLELPRILLGVASGWFVGGFMFLVATMSRAPRDPWDDGSRV